ncbi:MAG: nitric-oxide reductase large subunit [Chloroflexi bacterium]|nr:nitric-oxide reductase large subunit [Chloroflexota bacterium]
MNHAPSLPNDYDMPEDPQEGQRSMTRGLIYLWIGLIVIVVGSFAALLYYGGEVYQMAPPVPSAVTVSDGSVVFTEADINQGQDVWRSIGGHELGSVWGHGAYTAPDWTADWIHREAVWLLEYWAQEDYGAGYDILDGEQAAALRSRLQDELRTNTLNPDTGVITISPLRARAIEAVQGHYIALFGDEDDPELDHLRESYAMPRSVISTDERRAAFTAFLFWASWACVTERPGRDITYTHNWPPDDLVGNGPTPVMVVVSVVSFVLLLGGIGGLAWFFAASRDTWRSQPTAAVTDPMINTEPTPSMKATHKYFWVVGALAVSQIIFGIITAHYGVEGTEFYGIALAELLPYSLSRTWHVQLGMLWIATSWLATGLCLVPLIAGYEPKFQRWGVNVLLVALIIVVVGSMLGQAFAIHQLLGDKINFWFGHQGYEYLDLGRFWQALLLVGLLLWLALMLRPLIPAWIAAKGDSRRRQFLTIFMLSIGAIAFFYSPGLIPGQHTNLAIAEYWRWWVVHLWVEGFFEVFATAVISLIFVRLGLVRVQSAVMAILFTTILYLSGGVLGMFHHLYFTGTSPVILVIGGTFSALELMPLVMIGFEAHENLAMTRRTSWIHHYKWPVYFFIASAFWNLVGAGLFGFLINPPIALYYMQGLNTTAVHAHAALFGVYGNLGLGLTLLSLRLLTVRSQWRTGTLSFAFWTINIGLALMVMLSLLPVGLAQTWASVEHGMWYARSAEFLQTPWLEVARWLRSIGDTIFAAGILALGWFVIGLSGGWSRRGARQDSVAVPGMADD